jgi:hypothetical protein
MDKTLHKKLTEKHLYANTALGLADSEDMFASMRQEMKILHLAANDLLQPRPQAIASILEQARAL